MSWITKVDSEFIITTGDGKSYRPLWKNASIAAEYNVAEFEFPDLDGTLVKRGRRKGYKYNLEIYFQGEDNLDQAEAFRISNNNTNPWVITHPLYGQITVCSPSLNFDNSEMNVTKITGTVIETITDDNPKTVIDPVDNINLNKSSLDETIEDSFDVTPTQTDVNTMTTQNANIYKSGAKLPNLSAQSEAYFNLYNVANSSILTASSHPLAALRAFQAVISYPAYFEVSVENRIGQFTDQFDILRSNLGVITGRSSKKQYEATAATSIAGQCVASITPVSGDYGNRDSVLDAITPLIANYNQYLADLDSLQTDNGGSPDSYIPDAQSLIALDNLVNFTISSLFAIAMNAKQERSILCEDDTNWIILTHRFYGLDPADNNISELMKNNNAGLNEMLHVRKGRKVVYFI